jgi:DNA-binding NarL/FixJ family response regulator
VALRILIADDHARVRDAMASLLGAAGDLDVVAQADDGRSMIAEARRTQPDIVVMDVTMSPSSGGAWARQLMNVCPGAGLVVLSLHAEPSMVRAMIQAGARGYVVKDDAFDHLVSAVHAVARGCTYLSPAATSEQPSHR